MGISLRVTCDPWSHVIVNHSSSLRPYRRPLFFLRAQAACWLAEKLGATVPLDGEALERKALAVTGRTRFLGSSFREPLEILLRSLQTDARLNAVGRHGAALTLIRQLATRLCMEEAWGVADPRPSDLLQPARPPIFIVGMHRTGTTLLHKLMASDPAARPLLYWESAYPLVGPVNDPENRSAAVRRQCGLRTVETTKRLAPYLASIHDADPTGPEECHWLTMASLVTHAFPMQWRVGRYTAWLDERTEADWRRAYAEYLSLLGLLDGGMADRHWVLKCPLHAPRLATLANLVPNAIFIQTYRDIREVAGSLCSLTMAMRSVTTDVWNPAADGHDVAATLARDTRAAVRAAEQHQDRVIHVHYTALVRNPIDTIHRIYERAGMPWSTAAEAAMDRWLAANPQGRHGRHRYSLADFGLTESAVVGACGEYVATERRLADTTP
ncbi:MAG: sulfotransferase family protein [Pirellulales bacterium]